MKTVITRIPDEKKALFHAEAIKQGISMFSVLEGAIDLFLSVDKKKILLDYSRKAELRRSLDDKRKVSP